MNARSVEGHRACKTTSDPLDPRKGLILFLVERANMFKYVLYADMLELGQIL